MSSYRGYSIWLIVLSILSSFTLLPGCMTVSNEQTIVDYNPSYNFVGRKIAVLPVKAQTSLAPDSVLALRNEINKRLGPALREKLVTSTILDTLSTVELLNQRNALSNFEQLVTSYDNTGIIDKRQSNALKSALGSEFLVFSRLKAEKSDVAFVGKAMGTSLEVMIIAASTGHVAWSGSSEWKRGGIFGFGGAPAEEVANQLITLSLNTLQQASGTSGPLQSGKEASDAAATDTGNQVSKSKKAKNRKQP